MSDDVFAFAAPKTVHFVSLGCPKNRVDSEVMLGHLAGAGYTPVGDAHEADVIVVNTCGFIDAAKEESIDAICEMGQLKEEGRLQKLVVAGCLSQRYAPELAAEMPEVDHFLGTGNFETIAQVLGGGDAAAAQAPLGHRRLQVVSDAAPAKVHPRLRGRNALVPYAHAANPGSALPQGMPDPDFTLTAASPRVATQPSYMAYLKVSEGCSNTCAFCVIPKLRGPQRSRTIADVVAEAERLVLAGAVEINLIAQDLCAFGQDRTPREDLAGLLWALDDVGERMGRPLWIRCMYAYPKGLTDAVIDVMAQSKHILPYLDMPLQHIADGMLRRMRRGAGGASTRALLHKLRRRLPQLTLRTTLIAGMPGETQEEFEELCAFVQEMRFERMGVFAYSRESDTPAGEMQDQVPAELAEQRRARLLQIQGQISAEQQAALIGQTLPVLVEGVSEESDLLLQGRHPGQAPDIDGVTYIASGTASPGDVVMLRIVQAGDFDLVGEMCDPPEDTPSSMPHSAAAALALQVDAASG
jgi:ribosomal protein S12 methylthiotransferase